MDSRILIQVSSSLGDYPCHSHPPNLTHIQFVSCGIEVFFQLSHSTNDESSSILRCLSQESSYIEFREKFHPIHLKSRVTRVTTGASVSSFEFELRREGEREIDWRRRKDLSARVKRLIQVCVTIGYILMWFQKRRRLNQEQSCWNVWKAFVKFCTKNH